MRKKVGKFFGKMRIGRRALSLVLSLVIVVGLIPMMSTTSEAANLWNEPNCNASDIINRVGGFIESIAIANHDKKDTAQSYLTNNGYTLKPYDLNNSAGGDYIYMGCKRTSDYTKAITGIGLVSTSSKSAPADSIEKDGYTFYLVGGKYEPNGSGCGVVDLNENAGGKYIYMYITRDLSYNKPIFDFLLKGATKGNNTFPNEEDYRNGIKTPIRLEGGDAYGIDLNEGATKFAQAHFCVYLYTVSIVLKYDTDTYSSNNKQHWRPYKDEKKNGLSNWEHYRNKYDHTWENGKCKYCQYQCNHTWSKGVCTNCGLSCSHNWSNGVCKTCGISCSHSWSTSGYCTVCKSACSHPQLDSNETCTVCGYKCSNHVWLKGICQNCGFKCKHSYDSNSLCTICNNWCEHSSWNNGVCRDCGKVCDHPSYSNHVCMTCGMGCTHEKSKGICSDCGYIKFNYLDYEWNTAAGSLESTQKSISNYNSLVTSSSTSWSYGWYVVNKDVTVSERIYVTGTVHLLLCDGATLTADRGINVGEDSSLYIYSQSDDFGTAGKLIATGKISRTAPYKFGTGIGCEDWNRSDVKAGSITINGGIIYAKGCPWSNVTSGSAPGIGAINGSSGTVTINGGTVTAESGGSYNGIDCVASLIINGGNVLSKGNTTAKNSGGTSVSRKTYTIDGITSQTEVTAVNGTKYGINDLYTLDTNKLYLYLPSNESVTSVTMANEESYGPLKADDTTLYCQHKHKNGSICSNCGEYIVTKVPTLNADGYYLIGSAAELAWFANQVKSGNNKINARLTNDIDMSAASALNIGVAARPFGGVFDGDGHKIIYSLSGGQYTAPFPYVSGATIKNLTVDGKITATQKFAASIIGCSSGGDVMLSNCMSTVNIESSVDGDGTHGGMVANVSGGSLTVSNCGFMGSISGKKTTNCGGLVGWTNVAITIKNSFVSAKFSLKGGADSNTISRNAGKATVTNCYYLNAADKTPSDATKITDAQIKSGELAYKLNDQNGGANWFQNIDNGKTVDNHPVPNSSHGVVYYGYADCDDTEINYTNLKTSKTVQGHVYDGVADCLNAVYCQDCGKEMLAIDPNNHVSTETYTQYIDEETHGVYHKCCNALESTHEHSVTSASTCTGVSYCADCERYYGSIDADNHTGEVICEPKKNSNVYHEFKYNCCGTVIKTEEHNLEYTVDNDTMTITAVCKDCGAMGSVTMSLDSGVYNGYAFEAKYTRTGIYSGWSPYSTPIFEYCCEDGCKHAGGHSVSMTLESHWLGGDSEDEKVEVESATLYHNFSISKKQLKISEVKSWSKNFDNNTKIDLYGVTLDGVVVYDEGIYPFAWDDVTDNVDVDWDELKANVDSSAVGEYETVNLTGIVLKGTDINNYEIESEMTGLPLKEYGGGGNFSIRKCWVTVMPEDQYLEGSNTELDQTAYELSGLEEGFTVEGIEIKLDDYDRIYADCENVKVYTDDETRTDVTDSFEFSTYYANYSYVCEGHTYNDEGFCATGTCNAYQPAVKNDNNTTDDTYDDYYEIWNVGQLYWFAQQVNDYSRTDISGKLMTDLTVNPGTFDADGNYKPVGDEELKEWTPIAINSYTYYSGAFDGNGYTVSGLYCKLENSYVGFFGSLGYYTVDNLHIKNSYFEGRFAGAIAGYSGATINKCSAAADVYTKGTNAGGLVGNTGGYGTIKNSYSLAKTSGSVSGGLVGYNYAEIMNSYTNDMQPVGYNSYATLTNVYYGEDTRDYGTPDENGYVAVKPAYEGATEVTNAKDFKSGKITYLLQQGVKGDLLEYDGEGNPVYGEAEQVWYQTIGEQDWPSLSGKIVYYDETNDVYTNGNEEETPESAVVSVDYDKPILGGFNQYYFKIDGRPSKLQIAHSDGSTYTFNRYSTISVNGSRGVVSIKSYDKDGNEVDSLSRLVAYEVWTINLNLSEDDYTVKAKFEDEWEKGTTDFSISYDLTHGDVSVTEVKNTDSGYTFKLNGTAQKLRVVAADGATRTYNRNNANVTIKAYDANGDEVAVGSENVSYEIWTISAKLSSGNYTAIAKFYDSGAYYWSENEFAFEV